MSLPRVDNDTPYFAEPHLLCDVEGDKLCAIIKATFEHVEGPPHPLNGTFEVSPRSRRRPIRGADVPWGKPEVASIRYPSDLCVRKPGTDVIVVANAHAPGAEPVQKIDCGVRLASLKKMVRVTGPRVWLPDGDGVSAPRPFKSLALRYDYAFGGYDDSDPENIVEDARNPVGRGIACHLGSLEGHAAPQIEDVERPVRNASSRPKPAGVCAIGRHYEPRRMRWGTYDAAWLENRSPLPPRDFDERANLAATPELIAVPHLMTGEEGALENLTEGGGSLHFVLPKVRLSVRFIVKNQRADAVVVKPQLDTVILDTLGPIEHRLLSAKDPELPPPPPGPLMIELTWRASILAPRKLSDVEIVVREEGLR